MSEFSSDLEDVLQRAREAQIKQILTVNVRFEELEALKKISKSYPNIYFSAGIHPHNALDFDESHIYSTLLDEHHHEKLVAFGETGLDYYYNSSPADKQKSSFRAHLRASIETGIPVIIHTRDADDDTIKILDEYPGVTGVFHCFSGDINLAQNALSRGFYISFSGIITFKNAEVLRDVVKLTPLDKILVETDAPYLAPVPFRGKRNEPSFIRKTAELVGELKGVNLEMVAYQTTNNFYNLFKKARNPQ
jgi:TatD DNase family protein